MQTRLPNYLYDALPADVQASFAKHLLAVALPRGTLLYKANEHPRYAFFISTGLASVVANTPDGQTAEVGLIGRDGFTGSLHLLGPGAVVSTCFTQIEGTGMRLPMALLREAFDHNEHVRTAILAFVQGQSIFMEQLGACNLFHDADTRLARWLLMVQDRVESDIIDLTQEFLAQMLGSGRPTVTLACGSLQKRGCIEYRRGHIRILNRALLKELACSCYAVAAENLEAYRASFMQVKP